MDQQVDNRESSADAPQPERDYGSNVGYVVDVIKELPSLAEKKQLSRQQVESLYGLGYQLYEAQCYREAGDLFRLLCLFESRVAHHWIALGGAYQHSNHHDNALAAFTMACLLDPRNPEPRFYTAHTLVDLHDLPLALQSINIAIELCHHHPQYVDLYRRSMALRNALVIHLNR